MRSRQQERRLVVFESVAAGLGASRQSRLDSLHRHFNIRITGGEGIVVGEDHIFGAVVAEGGFVVAADDGEGVEDVGGVCAGEAVEVEVEGVEAGAQMTELLIAPD